MTKHIILHTQYYLACSLQIKKYEKLDSDEDRAIKSRQIFDMYIMKELLSCSHVSASDTCCHVRESEKALGNGQKGRFIITLNEILENVRLPRLSRRS